MYSDYDEMDGGNGNMMNRRSYGSSMYGMSLWGAMIVLFNLLVLVVSIALIVETIVLRNQVTKNDLANVDDITYRTNIYAIILIVGLSLSILTWMFKWMSG